MTIDNMRVVQWSMLANEVIFQGAVVLTLGGIICLIGGNLYNYQFWTGTGIYAIVIGVIIAALEYPRGKKSKGNTITRRYHECFTHVMNRMLILHNYTVRAVFYLVCAVPTFITTPTLLGSLLLLMGSAIYYRASCNDECWSPVVAKTVQNKEGQSLNVPPSRPPPRPPAISKTRTYATSA